VLIVPVRRMLENTGQNRTETADPSLLATESDTLPAGA
jgi:hypothetical protein